MLALLADGIFPVPLDPALTAAERERILAPIAPDLVVTRPAQVDDLLAGLPGRGRSLPRGRPIHCTSGTTGTPKGVWSGVLTETEADALVAEERDLWGFAADDVNLVISPLHHSAPLRFAMGTLLAGGRIAVPGRFDPDVLTRTIVRERPTTMFCVPTHLQRLFAHWDEVGVPDLSSSGWWRRRRAMPAGRQAPPGRAVPDGSTWEFDGSTEGEFTACRSEDCRPVPARSVGRAPAGVTTDDDGHLWCAVPLHARFTYLGAPEQTAAAWRDTEEVPPSPSVTSVASTPAAGSTSTDDSTDLSSPAA